MGHDGVFVVSEGDVEEYVKLHCPQVLRLNRKFLCQGFDARNFGESKGLGFNRVLIFPYTGIRNWIQTGEGRHIKGSAPKVYVAVTRARQSVAFVFDGVCRLKDIQVFKTQASDRDSQIDS
jgi:DNA helicase II / ATP-dependent DNA helicase PcrA